MTRAEGVPGEIEAAVLADEGVTVDDFDKLKRMKIHGSRRALRFFPEHLAITDGKDEFGPFVELQFALASGCYATMLLREICKSELEEGSSDQFEEEE
jgi:tRNA(Glu) U13 pseudouridine synthase TruD